MDFKGTASPCRSQISLLLDGNLTHPSLDAGAVGYHEQPGFGERAAHLRHALGGSKHCHAGTAAKLGGFSRIKFLNDYFMTIMFFFTRDSKLNDHHYFMTIIFFEVSE